LPNSGHNAKLAGGGFHHVAIRVRDYDRSLRFYQEVLGFTQAIAWGDAPKRAAMLDTGDGNYLEVFERPDEKWADADPCILHLALRCGDIDAVIDRVRAAGAEITVEPKTLTVGKTQQATIRLAFFKGPDGEVIELFDCPTL
jgi:glyoxylase I family protein